MTHPTHEMHPNSLTAYAQERGRLSGRALQIHQCLLRYGPLTDRGVMAYLGFSDMNSVRPRITELIRHSWAREVGRCKDPHTKKTVRFVEAVHIKQ